MRDIPERQFGLFTVVIEDYIEGHEKLFQTFSDAFDYISKYAKGAEIFEVESDSFKVVYTFISRKTNGYIKFATATVRAHLFTYNDGTFKEDRVRSSGDSTIYKYGKFIFHFSDSKEKESLIKFFNNNLKQIFIKENGENNEVNTMIIAGKLGTPLNDLLDHLFRKDILEKTYLVKEATIEFYEFYEELISEFDKEEEGIRIDCDEKILKHLWEDWKMLKVVREFVEGYKKKDTKE